MSVEQIEYRGHTIEIVQDELAESPRGDDNLGRLYCRHRRYNLGDEKDHLSLRDRIVKLLDEVGVAVEEDAQVSLADLDAHYLVLHVALLDHSGLRLYEGTGAHPCDPGGWDSGQIGFMVVSHQRICREYGVQAVGDLVEDADGSKLPALEMAARVLRAELRVYGQYLAGECYAYTLDGRGGCGGYCATYGDEDWQYMVGEAKAAVDRMIGAGE